MPSFLLTFKRLRRSLLQRLWQRGLGFLGKISRFFRSISPDQATPDDRWAKQYLNEGESIVYMGMDPRDRDHACRVARLMLQDFPELGVEVVAAALLHDCGKSIRRYNVIERVLVGFVPNRIARVLPPLGALGIRAYHPELGAQLLAHAGARPRVCQLVARHHYSVGDPEAQLLHYYDERD